LILKFSFTMVGYKLLLMHFLPFPWPINYNHASQCNKSFTHSLLIWFWLKISFPFLESMVLRVATSYEALSYTSEQKTSFGVIFRLDVDVTSLWWKTQTAKGVRLSWSWSPSSLVLLHFSELSHLSDFVASWPRFCWWTWNCLWKRHLYFCMVFNFWHWTLLLVAWSNSLTTF
jgi:hypothetical protein